MTTLVAISHHADPRHRRMGIHRALMTRQANLGDCADARDVLRRLASPRYLRKPACVIPIRRRSQADQPTASDLALAVARRTLAHAHALPPEAIGAVVYCHVVPDENTSESTAGRLQWELGLKAANPFAISQAHHGALLVGLDIAAALVEGPEQLSAVLLVASDKLLQESPAAATRGLLFGDAAAAALVCRDDAPGWRLEEVCTQHFALDAVPRRAWSAMAARRFVDAGTTLIAELLSRHAIDPARLGAVVTTVPDAPLVARIHCAARLAAPSLPVPAAAAVPDLLAALGRLHPATPRGAPALAWTGGPNGEFACALMTRT